MASKPEHLASPKPGAGEFQSRACQTQPWKAPWLAIKNEEKYAPKFPQLHWNSYKIASHFRAFVFSQWACHFMSQKAPGPAREKINAQHWLSLVITATVVTWVTLMIDTTWPCVLTDFKTRHHLHFHGSYASTCELLCMSFWHGLHSGRDGPTFWLLLLCSFLCPLPNCKEINRKIN